MTFPDRKREDQSGSDDANTGARTSRAPRPSRVSELPSTWRPIKGVQQRMEDGIAAVYDRLGIEGVRPRFSMALMFLDDGGMSGGMSIRELADRCGVTHSAMSQSVAVMRDAELVESEPGTDARSRVITLTARGHEVAAVFWREWYATETAVREVAEEAGVDLEQVAAGMGAALDRESFTDRVLRHLQAEQ
ncbi:helix-turn-helix domain-containing protein [Humibacter sp.]|uniref:MarR family winged helix-turn-helix transcriptional regulator n=1 Tax=Humibacter sp. TaxID=1940291 RepID=UPI002BF17A6A|nr:helix-turn-helix domain-containing protein [Humibacter sp.]HVX09375.1 helix-turn-helix domain-containing protein [Humibacter sp.]